MMTAMIWEALVIGEDVRGVGRVIRMERKIWMERNLTPAL